MWGLWRSRRPRHRCGVASAAVVIAELARMHHRLVPAAVPTVLAGLVYLAEADAQPTSAGYGPGCSTRDYQDLVAGLNAGTTVGGPAAGTLLAPETVRQGVLRTLVPKPPTQPPVAGGGHSCWLSTSPGKRSRAVRVKERPGRRLLEQHKSARPLRARQRGPTTVDTALARRIDRQPRGREAARGRGSVDLARRHTVRRTYRRQRAETELIQSGVRETW